MTVKKAALSLLCCLLSGTALAADAGLLNPMFQDHGVLQRDKPLPVWGHAAAGEQVTVVLAGPAGSSVTATAKAGKDGRWQATLPAQQAGGPFTLTASTKGGASQQAADLLVGDVYLCSGQSNMEMTVARSLNSWGETGNANHPDIRMLTVQRDTATHPLDRFGKPTSWQAVTPQTVPDMSAVCYFYGREMRQIAGVPVGLIHSSWGGSQIETWMPAAELGKQPDYKAGLSFLAKYDRDRRDGVADFVRTWQDWWQQVGKGEPWREVAGSGEGWREMPAGFQPWERWGVADMAKYDGLIWMRTTVTLTAEQAKQAVALRLGPVDDQDVTWINGKPVGTLYGPADPRRYPLAPGVLKAGVNNITIAVIDFWDNGGLYGSAADQAMELADGSTVPLASTFQYKPMKVDMSATPRAPWGAVDGLTTLNNAMIAPIGPYGLRGALWYQGEANAGRPAQYQGLLAGMMAGWRRQFGADLPFLIVQLPEWGYPVDQPVESSWASLREAQRRAVAADAHAGLAVGMGVGDWYDIHPTNKQIMAKRLAQAARKVVLGQAVPPSGPVPVSATRQGDAISIRFSDITGKLSALSFHRPVGFQLCGDAVGSCRFADATLSGDTVTLATGGQPATRVRYCWADSPVCNLYDEARQPAEPFELPVK